MTGWKKYVMVAVICLLLLGLMLYGDLGNRFGGQNGRNTEFESATVNDMVERKVTNLGPAQIADVVNLYRQTGVPAVIDIYNYSGKEASPEEMMASWMYYNNAFEKEHYAASPKEIEDIMNSRVWHDQDGLVNPDNPQRDELRLRKVGELGTTMKSLQNFIRRYVAGRNKEAQFAFPAHSGSTADLTNRAEMSLLYRISHERARVRYMSFPASNYLEAAKLAVTDKKEDLQKQYDADKVKRRTREGETGDSMSKSLKLQFDMFWCEQDSYYDEVAKSRPFDKTSMLAEYEKRKKAYEIDHAGALNPKTAESFFSEWDVRGVAKPTINPAFKDQAVEIPLPPEDWVLAYLKDQLVKTEIILRAQKTMVAFGKKYNEAVLAAPVEARAELASHFLADLKKADPTTFDAQFKNVEYMRTSMADFSTYEASHQEKISAATPTPNYLATFFDHINRGELKDFQSKLSNPLNYTLSWADGKATTRLLPGGSIAFLVHAVENLDEQAAVMAFDDPATQQLLINRLAFQKAPELAQKAAQDMKDAWEKDPSKIPNDPKIVTEYIADASPTGDRPNMSSEERRQEEIMFTIEYGPESPSVKVMSGEQAPPGKLIGPSEVSFEPPKVGAPKKAGDEEMLKCYIVGFVVQYHQIGDVGKKVEGDPAWRTSNEFNRSQGDAMMFCSRVLAQSVRDAYIVTLVKKKGS